MNCDDAQLRLHAYLDDELGPVESAQIGQHLDQCPNCLPVYRQMQALRAAVRTRTAYFTAPEGLETSVRSALRANVVEGSPRREVARKWLGLGAALAITVVATWSLTLLLSAPGEQSRLLREVVSDHVRSLMARHLTDVASSDEHAVKPWFNGKLNFSPPVRDLTTQGFPLVGGRLDYLHGRPVAALVYRHRKHPINLFVWPAPAGAATGERTYAREGYNVVHWVGGGMNFWAISDLNRKELQAFARLLRRPDVGEPPVRLVPGAQDAGNAPKK